LSGEFDPYAHLEQQLGRPVDRAAVRTKRRARFAELMASQSLLPGVRDYISKAKELGLKLGLASNASRSWVIGYIASFEIGAYFDSLVCADDVERTKPDPALYLVTLQALGVGASETVAFEDSPNGILAAKRAGVFCVAVPNALTRHLSLDLADLRLSSMSDLALEELLLQISGRANGQVTGESKPSLSSVDPHGGV
jgi:HAD superfamily hydrolase (TIGR01509 family)